MAKIPRIHIEGALLYVTSRGDNDREIFKDKDDYSAYVDLLRKYKEQYGFKLFAYCLLPNHLHLLLELKEGLTVSDIMHDLNANYTKSFNARYERKGHLFQERYKMIIMEKDTYMLETMAYIHLNPIARGLAKDLKEYPYSSYLSYSSLRGGSKATNEAISEIASAPAALRNDNAGKDGHISQSLNIDMEEEIREAGSRFQVLGFTDYADYLAGVTKEKMENLGSRLTKSTILGSKEFMERIERVAQELSAANKEAVDQGGGILQGKFIKISVGVIVVLAIFSLYLYSSFSGLKKNFSQELDKKNVELSQRLKKEKEKVAQDLQERYAADMVSYEAMARRMELEKQKSTLLEVEMQKLKAESPKAKNTKGAKK